MTFGSLFAGIGGMDLGLERSGMTCKWQVEIDPFARRVLAKHWPDVRQHDDVRTFPPTAAEEWSVDLVCGGFPCQDISFAGPGAGINGARSGLWLEYARIIRDLRPRYVLVENVSALLVRGMGEVLGTLAALGLDAEWSCIPASAIGAPHRRDRIFIVAYSDSHKHLCGMAEGQEGSGQAKEIFGSKPVRTTWWDSEPRLGRVADGIPSSVVEPRLQGLGNSVVPQVAEWIGRRIIAMSRPPDVTPSAGP